MAIPKRRAQIRAPARAVRGLRTPTTNRCRKSLHTKRKCHSGLTPKTIRLTGGAARSEPWVQIFADCFQVPVEIPAGSELGALGAAICAGVAVGLFADYPAAVAAMVQIERVQEPEPAHQEVYAANFARYQKVLEALGPVWREFA